MTSTKYIGMDVHKEGISIAVRNAAGKIVMEYVIETKASVILQFFEGLRGDLQVTLRKEPQRLGCMTGPLAREGSHANVSRVGFSSDSLGAQRSYLANWLRISEL